MFCPKTRKWNIGHSPASFYKGFNLSYTMKIEFKEGAFTLERTPDELDKFVLDFINVLDRVDIKYVIVSGYVSILFGRSRNSEDVDLIIAPITEQKFVSLWKALENFDCLNTDSSEEAYQKYLQGDIAIRFARHNEAIPNMEIKLARIALDKWALDQRLPVVFNSIKLYVSPIELQIAYKLLLGSEKDIEDARHLYKLLEEYLDKQVLARFNRQFKVEELFRRYIE